MKKLLLFLLFSILIFTMVGCKKEVSALDITNSTNEIWDSSTKNEATEMIIFKKLNIGGVMDIDNLVFDVEKKFENGKLGLVIETRKNMAVRLNENVKDIIDMVLDYKKLEENLKVKHLEQAWSKVGLKINMQMDENSAHGFVEFLNVKDMFKANLTKPIKIDINLDNLAENQNYQMIYKHLKCHPICTFVPESKVNINVNKQVPVAFETSELSHFADGYICNNCDKRINDSDFTLKHILFDTFSETTGEGIIKNTLQMNDTQAKINVITKDSKQYIDTMSVTSNLNINISKSQLETMAKEFTAAYNNEKLYEIFKSIIGILNYDTALLQSEIEVVVTNRVL